MIVRVAVLSLVAGVLWVSPLYATEEENKPNEDLSEYVLIRPFISLPSTKFTISRYSDHGYKLRGITYKPNNYFDFGVCANYRMFGTIVSFATAGIRKNTRDQKEYGKSEARNLQLSFFKEKISGDFFFQKYDGFYLAAPSKYGLSTGGAHTVRPDISLINISGNLLYVISDDYSFPASMNNTIRMRHSAGSFLVMGSFGDLDIRSGASMIPASEADTYGDFAGFRHGRYRSIGLAAGYAYSVIMGKYFITPVLFVGSGIMQKTETTGSGRYRNYGSYNKLNVRLAAGYNGDRFVAGIRASNDTVSSRNWFAGRGNKVSFQVILVMLYAGYRF